MSDIGAVAWKEWRELFGERGMRGKLGMVMFVAAFGVVLPLMNGPVWVQDPIMALTWSWVPLFLVMNVIADAFAGERERHTLETLLASRLSEDAILFGKMAAAVGYAATLTAASLILGVITLNLAHRGGGLLVYPLPVIEAMLGLGLLGAVLVAAIGMLISLRAATVRQAQQALGAAIMGLVLAPVLLIRLAPPAWRQALVAHPMSAALLGILLMAALASLDVAAIALARHRFRRTRLIL